MAAEKHPPPAGDWSWGNPGLAAERESFRRRYPLYAAALDDPGADPADREAMEHAWLLWLTDARRRGGR